MQLHITKYFYFFKTFISNQQFETDQDTSVQLEYWKLWPYFLLLPSVRLSRIHIPVCYIYIYLSYSTAFQSKYTFIVSHYSTVPGRLGHLYEGPRSHSDEPHSVGRLWTGDRSFSETYTDNLQTSQETDIYASCGIRTHDPSKRVAVEPHLRLHDHYIYHTEYHIRDKLRIRNVTQPNGVLNRVFYDSYCCLQNNNCIVITILPGQ